jgi:glutamate dehydrogenase/leucine dehydrogenase
MFLERAASKTDIPHDMYKFIESCQAVVRFNIPLKMDNGSIKTVTCYR